MTLQECKDWKAVILDNRTILKQDTKLMSADQVIALANLKVIPTDRKGYYKAV